MLNSAFCIADSETECCVFAMDGVGLTARRKTIGMPFEMPPRMPPQWFVSVTTRPSSTRYASLFSLPRRHAAAKPRPNAIPLTAGMAKASWLILFSNPPNIGSPSPAGTPVIWQRMRPPTESSSARACAIAAFMCSADSSLVTGKSFRSTGARNSDVSSIPAIASMRAMTSMP